jgi:hypothetical protein
MAEARIHEIDDLFKKSDLPEMPDAIAAENKLIEIREAFYK